MAGYSLWLPTLPGKGFPRVSMLWDSAVSFAAWPLSRPILPKLFLGRMISFGWMCIKWRCLRPFGLEFTIPKHTYWFIAVRDILLRICAEKDSCKNCGQRELL